MSNVPTNLIPTRITGLPEYTGTSTLGYMAYVLEGRTYKVQFSNIAAVGAVPSTRVIGTGNGLEGGGDLSQNRTISIISHGVGYSQLDFTGVTAGTYGSADTIPALTIDATGRVTAAVNTPVVLSNYVPSSRTVTAGAGLTGGGQLNNNITIALNPSNATPQSLGAASAGTGTQAARDDHVHPAVDLTDTSETQGVLPLGRGGTGVALSPVVGAVIYADNDSLNQTIAGNAGQILKSAGGLGAPYWDDLLAGGTVTSVSVTSANGFAGTVANPTSTPAITLTTTVTGMVKGNGTAISAATAAVDYVAPGLVTTSGLTMATDRLLGRTTASTGAVEQITVGTGLSLSAGSLTNSAPDQVVSLTGAGTTVVTGTYPSFTITSNDQYVGTVTSVGLSGGTTGLSVSGTNPITTSGTFTLGGTLVAANGGTGFASYTTGDMLYASGSTALTTLGIGSNTFILTSTGTTPQWSNPTGVTVGTATNLAGGASGSIPYQSAAGATTFLASGTGVLVNSAGNPSYSMNPSLTQVTVAGNPSAALEVATKQYVDNLVSSGITYHTPVKYEVPVTTGNLTALYNQPGGAGVGVGATLTNNGTKAAFAPDGPTASVGDRILIYNQTNAFENGVYTVTTVGTPDPGGTNWVLTRATDADTYGIKDPNSLGNGDAFFITSGDTGAGETYVLNTVGTITFGVTSITFVQVSDATLYTAGNGLQLTSGTVFSLISPVVTSNGGTGLTSFTSGGAVYATSTSALTTGTLPATAGGTGFASYAVGDLLYASTTTALSKLADVATGNALISGGVNTAPSWGKIGLTTHVSGTLEVGNGGTGATTLTGYVKGNGTSAFTASATIPGSDVTGAALTEVDDTNVTLTLGGSPSTALLAATSMTLGWTGQLAVSRGGTGASSLTSGYLLKGNGTSAVSASVVYDDGTNVGIGTASPTVLLDVFSATAANLSVRGNSATNITAHRSSFDATGPNLVLRKSRGSSASQIAVATGDNMGTLVFSAFGGTNNRNIATIASNVELYLSDTLISSNMTFSTTPYGSVTPSERMRIDSSGNVGIGTTSPGFKLEVTGDIRLGSGGDLRLGSATGTTGSSGDSSIFSDANDMNFSVGSNIRMYIANGGNVGIGTTSPASKLAVGGNTPTAGAIAGVGASGGISLALSDNANSSLYVKHTAAGVATIGTDGGGQLALAANGFVEQMRINSAGVGIGTSSPGSLLDVVGTSATDIFHVRNGTTYFTAGVTNGTQVELNAYQTAVGAKLLSIQSAGGATNFGGNVGIGTSSPGFRLDVSGDAHTSGSVFTGSNADGWGRFVNSGGALYVQAGSLNSGGATAQPIIFTNMYGGSERMRITAAGNVGIGTSAPTYKFEVTGQTLIGNGVAQASPSTTDIGSTSHAIISGLGGNALFFGQYPGAQGYAQWIQSSFLNPTTAKYNLVLQPLGGAVGVGVSTPNATLHLQGIQGGNGRMSQSSPSGTSQNNLNLIASTSAGSADQWFSYGVTAGNYYFIQTGVGTGDSGLVVNSNNRVMVGTSTAFDTTVGANLMSLGTAGSAAAFKVNATSSTQVSFYDSTQTPRVGWIGTSGSSTSFNTTSDRRLKQNIQPVGDVGNKIDQIEIVSHQWRNGTDTVIPYGVIAQDLYEVAPHAVTKGDDGEEIVLEWGVDYSKLVPMMIKEMQSMRARLAELEGK